MDRIINVTINGTYLTKDSNRAGIRGEGNAVILRIAFDEGWRGFSKTVTFWNAKGENENSVKVILGVNLLDDPSKSDLIYLCRIPMEAMTEAGDLIFIVDGWHENGIRIRSAEGKLEVADGKRVALSEDVNPPTATQIEQLTSELDFIRDNIQTVATNAETAAKAAEDAETAKVKAGQFATEAATSAGLAENAYIATNNAALSVDLKLTDMAAYETSARASAERAGGSASQANDTYNSVVSSEGRVIQINTDTHVASDLASIYASNARASASEAKGYADTVAKAEVVIQSGQVARDADRAESAAEQAEAAAEKAKEIAGGDFATPAEVSSAISNHNADASAHLMTDTTTGAKYRWGVDNGAIYVEEVV